MAEEDRLRECPVCGAIGLEERIDEHGCSAFLERNERSALSSGRVRDRRFVPARPEQVLDGYPLSIAETISCPGCRSGLTEGDDVVVLAYRPHWSDIWAIETIRCRSCGFDSIRSTDRPGEHLPLEGRITTNSDGAIQHHTLTFSVPSIHDGSASESTPTGPSERGLTTQSRSTKSASRRELRR